MEKKHLILGEDILVRCADCDNLHWWSERTVVNEDEELGVTGYRCPNCGEESYIKEPE